MNVKHTLLSDIASEKQQIFSIEKLEQVNVWHFSFKKTS